MRASATSKARREAAEEGRCGSMRERTMAWSAAWGETSSQDAGGRSGRAKASTSWSTAGLEVLVGSGSRWWAMVHRAQI